MSRVNVFEVVCLYTATTYPSVLNIMAVYVDNAAIPWHGKLRYHLSASTLEELHLFAMLTGINRCWFHRGARHPHYDITLEQRTAALAAGALEVTSRDMVRIGRALSQKRTAEKPVFDAPAVVARRGTQST